MATADPLAKNDAPSRSIVALLWARWKLRRQRLYARSRSQVRFRLTREGLHYLGILLFIFVGAVIREISLLILLAGAMIGLMLLQWRFNKRTLLDLHVRRRMPTNIKAGRSTSISMQISNHKKVLGAWLVMLEDQLTKIEPVRKRLSERGIALADEVRPGGATNCTYELEFHTRGRYRVGPTIVSTRFPIGLGRGWQTLDNAELITVHPRIGELKPAVSSLFQLERQGSDTKSSTKSGVHEAEFFGLRPWESGDSRRWIHWRTTARMGELMVRQFEQQQRQQICILLDLFHFGASPSEEILDSCEQAISFVATLASRSVIAGRHKLALAVAADRPFCLSNIQSPVLVNQLLDQLAVVSSISNADLMGAIRQLSMPILSNPNLLVISTRENQLTLLRKAESDSIGRRVMGRLQVKWINVTRGGLEPYFRWTNPK